MSYTSAQKSSSWTPPTQAKSSQWTPPPMTVQTKPSSASSDTQEMPSYKPLPADWATNNPIMRGLLERESSQAEGQSSHSDSAVEGNVQLSADSGTIQRQCEKCQSELSAEEEKPLVQAKLTVGAPGDPYEQEADRVAAQVMSMSAVPDNSPPVQRFGEEENPVQTKSLAQSITPVVQRRVNDQVQLRELVQRAFQASGTQASGDLESRLNASKGGGSPLTPEVRAFMEPRFGADFSAVRVHTGGEAVQLNRELGAQAFAHGSDVYFGEGKSPGNNELTAHELTHVVQQTRPQQTETPFVQRDSQIPYSNPITAALDSAVTGLGFLVGRALTAAEISILTPVYGSYLNYSVIRVCEGSLCSPDGTPRTIGNVIAARPGFSSRDLIHECAHVWQHQKGISFGYIPSALGAQALSWILTDSRSGAYNYSYMVNHKIPWCCWNAEQQAQWIEDNMKLPPVEVWMSGGLLAVDGSAPFI